MVNFEPDQAEKLAEIGAQLKQIRKEKGLSLEQISAQTLIQSRTLQAIEDGKPERLPEPIYTQGFIRRFAEALDLDGTQIASTLPLQATRPLEQPGRQYYRPQLRPFHLYVIYLALIVAAVAGLSYLNDRSQNGEDTDSIGASPTVEPEVSGSPAASPVPGNSPPGSSPTPTPMNQTLDVSVSLQGNSWLEVVADGQTVFEGTLETGTQRNWSAKQTLTIYAGNAGAVLVKPKNGEAKPVGASGAVESVTFQAGSASFQ